MRQRALADAMFGEAQRGWKELLGDLKSGKAVDVGGYMLTSRVFESLRPLDYNRLDLDFRLPVFLTRLQTEVTQNDKPSYAYDEHPFWRYPSTGSGEPPPSRLFGALEAWYEEQG